MKSKTAALLIAGLCAAAPAAAQTDNPSPEVAVRACRAAPRVSQVQSTARSRFFVPTSAEYSQAVFDAIVGQWQQTEFVKDDWVELRFNLLRDGKVGPMTIAHHSKSDERDLEAMRAVARAALVAGLPEFPAAQPADTIPMMIALGDVSSYGETDGPRARDRRSAEPSRRNEAPEWPSRLQASEDVHVIAEIEIGVDGRVDMENVRIVASPHPRLTEELMHVLPSWRFSPALEDCVPVRSRIRLTQAFGGTPNRPDPRQ